MDGVATDEVFLEGTMELLRRCDAVVLVPNWRDSAGAQAEVAEAERLGLPVFGKNYSTSYDWQHTGLTLDDLKQWVKGGVA
jgi:hypothetical protein